MDQIRLIADYLDEGIDRERGLSAMEQANQFVEAVSRYVEGQPRAPVEMGGIAP